MVDVCSPICMVDVCSSIGTWYAFDRQFGGHLVFDNCWLVVGIRCTLDVTLKSGMKGGEGEGWNTASGK